MFLSNLMFLLCAFTLLATTATSHTQPSKHAHHMSPGIYSIASKTYTADNIDIHLKQRIYELQSEFREQLDHAISDWILDEHLKELATKQNKSIDKIYEETFKVEVSEKELKDFYERNKDRISYPYDKAKPQLQRYLHNKKRSEKREAYIDDLKKEGKFQLLVAKPVAPVFKIATAGFPTKGVQNTDSDTVELVKFSDYQCPHCKEAYEALQTLLPKYKGKIKFVHIDFPINSSGISRKVARGSFCAQEQDKYWEYHGLAFKRQANLTANAPTELAAELKLDLKAFNACYGNSKSNDYVEQALQVARDLRVNSTPTFYVNGRRVMVHHDIEKDLTEALDTALQTK